MMNSIMSSKDLNSYESDTIIDTRFQSYSRVYIHDIQNAEIINNNEVDSSNQCKKGIIKINNSLLNKVAICGIIVNIYEAQKYYRLKIDDATGCINVTLWKSSIFNDQSLGIMTSSDSSQNSNYKENFNQFYSLLNAIQTRIKDQLINNRIMYEPKQGDLVLIRAQVKCYRQRVELNANSCSRVQNSTNEMIQMVLPSILMNKVYSKQPATLNKYEEVNQIKNDYKKFKSNNNSDNLNLKEKEIFINLVNKRLVQMTTNIGNNMTLSNNSVNAYSLFNFIKSDCSIEFSFVTYKHILDALKELETRGLIYSCEDEFHYLPMNE